MDFPASVFYAIGRSGFAVECTCNSQTFAAIHSPVDAMAFDAAAHTTHQIRYAMGPALPTGALVTVSGSDYRLAGTPRRINAEEMLADLVMT